MRGPVWYFCCSRLFARGIIGDMLCWNTLVSTGGLEYTEEFLSGQGMLHWLHAWESRLPFPLEGMPVNLRRRAQRAYSLQAERNLALWNRLERLLQSAWDAGAAAMLLKGAELLVSLYDDRALRPLSDFDLLIRPEEAQLWSKLACQAGYERYQEDFNLCPLFVRWDEPNFSFIETHFEIAQPWRFTVPSAMLWSRAGKVALGRAVVSVPGELDRILILLVNMAHDRFASPLFKYLELHWLLEVVAADRQAMEKLRQEALRAGLGRVFYVALEVLRHHFDVAWRDEWQRCFAPRGFERELLFSLVRPEKLAPFDRDASTRFEQQLLNVLLVQGVRRRVFAPVCYMLERLHRRLS